jgi:Rv0078B-related antitoxin
MNWRSETVVDPKIEARVRATFELFAMAELMMRENLRRRFPVAADSEIEERLLAWRQRRPVALPLL